MADVGIRELLEAGVHFGHQTRRWNPKMRRFIYGERAGIHIIDLQKTSQLLERAQEFAAGIAARGGTVMFVGTKKQARDAIKEAAERAGMPYIDQRWLGGLLTNFQTINKRIKRLHDLDQWVEDGTLDLLPTRERISAMSEREKLTTNLGGVRNLQRPPDAIFIVDLKTEEIGVREALRLKIPIIGLVDTNVDPDPTTYPIPGNDDAIRSCKVIIDAIGDVVRDRATQFRAEEEAARKEAEEAARKEAEEKRRREEEERVRKEAEEAAARQAEAEQRAALQGDPAQANVAPQPQQAASQPQQQRERPKPARPRRQDRPSGPAPAQPAAEPAAAAAEPVAAAPEPAEPAAPEPAAPDATPAVAGAAEVRQEAEAQGEERPPREVQEQAERDAKAPEGEVKRPRGPEEAEAKASVEEADHDQAKTPDQEVS
jgi:small subunit ribosomal protein S2